MSSHGGLPAPRSAINFCELISAKQRSWEDVGVILQPSDKAELNALLVDYLKDGHSAALERRALNFLMVYREREKLSPVLDDNERAQLDALISAQWQAPASTPVRSRGRGFTWPNLTWLNPRRGIAGLVVFGLLVLGGLGVNQFVENSRAGSPPPGVVQQHPPAPQVQPGTTDLQNFKQDYGPFIQVQPSHVDQHSGTQALLFLEDGGYFDSATWTIDPNAAGWQQDIAGNVNNVDVHGNFADITNADGLPYTVGINQPFVFSNNPETVLMIDPTGNVSSMSLAQATAVRHILTK